MHRISSNMSSNDMNYHLRTQEFKLNQVENQMGSQNRIQDLRDDPVAAAHSTRYQSLITRLERFDQNVQEVQSNLRITETHMSKAQDILQRINELSIQGANGTYAKEDLANMGSEVNELLKELVSIGNAKGADGQPIFAGDKVDTNAFRVLTGRVPGAEGSVITQVDYIGSIAEKNAEIADNTHIKTNFAGNKVFWTDQQKVYSPVDSQNYQVPFDTHIRVDGQDVPLRAGDNIQTVMAKVNSANVAVKTSLDPVTNGIVFETTVPHQLWLEDAPGSNVLQKLGILTDRSGLEPPHNIHPDARVFGGSLFDSVIHLRDNMLAGNNEALGGQSLAGIQASLKNLQTNLAELGARDSRLTETGKKLEDEIPKVVEKNSNLVDLDVTEGITRMKMLEFTHQASLRAAARILPNTLMDFLR